MIRPALSPSLRPALGPPFGHRSTTRFLTPPFHLTHCLPTYTQHGAVSSVDLDTHAEAPLDAASTLATGGHTSEPKPSVQALVHMEADGRIGATEAAVHALVMTHNLTLRERRLRVSFLSGERHVEK